MPKTKQTRRINKLLKPDVIIDLDKTVTNPFDLLQLEAQLQVGCDTSDIESIVDGVIAENPGPTQDYHDGKKKAIGFLVGQVMKATQGQANPQLVNQTLRQKLEG